MCASINAWLDLNAELLCPENAGDRGKQNSLEIAVKEAFEFGFRSKFYLQVCNK